MIGFVNGTFIELQKAVIPVSDLGLQRGYGVFDFLRVKETLPLFLDAHMDRLYRSLDLMRLSLNYSKEQLTDIVNELIHQNKPEHSGIRITVTGGASPDGYTPVKPHIIIVQQPIAAPPDTLPTGAYKLVTHAYRRQMPEVKTTDYLMAIWLQPWIKEQGANDVLYLWEGNISECPRANFFIVTQNNTLVTPGAGMLKGVTRANILSVAKELLAVEERAVTLEDLHTAKEAFISSSTKRIIPVTAIDDLVLGDYTKDSVAAALFDRLRKLEG
jgi:branched-chain amino acid aminotransferase